MAGLSGGTLALMLLRQFVIDGLGHLSTLIADESAGLAAVVDPRRDVDIYLEAARSADLRSAIALASGLLDSWRRRDADCVPSCAMSIRAGSPGIGEPRSPASGVPPHFRTVGDCPMCTR